MSRGFSGTPVRHAPRPLARITDPTILRPEAFPSGENQEGKVWSWSPNTQRMELRHPKIFFGPGALDASTGNISLTTNTWVKLTSAVPLDGRGFRSGLVAYTPRGRYGLFGHVAISTPSVNLTYYARVMQGTTETDPTNQPNIAIGAPVVVGGGINSSPGASNIPFSIPFSASDIQYAGAPDHAAEIWVEVYAENTGVSPGSALAATSVGINSTISKLTIIRWDGLYGTQ